MATKKVNIDIIAKDKSKQALNRVRGNLDGLKKSVFNLRNAFIGLGAGLVIRNIVGVGKEIENLQVRLKFLFGSVEEGAKAFDEMAKFAAKVPFSLAEIQKGAGVLAVVSKDAEELAKNMELTGNVAAVTGLDFKTTAEQIQRSLSAGISAADLFRDRGVKAMLGFKAGATVSIEETVEAFERVFGSGGQFAGATDELAKTFEGTISMIGDKVFNFKRTILEAGFFPELKRQFGDLNKFMEENSEALDKFAVTIGSSLAFAVEGLANALKLAKDNSGLLLGVFKAIVATKIVFTLFRIARALQAIVAGTMLLIAAAGPIAWVAIGAAVTAATATYVGLGVVIDELADKIDFAFNQHKAMNRVVKHGGEEFLKVNQRSIDAWNKSNAVIEKRVTVMDNSFSKEMKALNKLFLTEEQKLVSHATKQTEIIKNELANNKNLKVSETKRLNELLITIRQKLSADLRQIRIDEILTQAKIDQTELDKLKAIEDEKVRIKKEGEAIAFQNTKDTLSALSGLNKTAFKVFQAFSISEAIINAYKGASNAMGAYTAPLSYIVAASSLAKGFALVAQIRAQSYSGREHGGAVQKGKPYMVGEAGREMFVPNQSGNIVPNDELGRAVNVNFNINTVDARGFNELLTNSRATIVGMINSAVNETGRQAII